MVIQERRDNIVNPGGNETPSSKPNILASLMGKSNLSKDVQKAVNDVESDAESFEDELKMNRPEVKIPGLEFIN